MENNKSILSIRIKELRTDLGMTQEELALKLGLKGKSSIANYESDKITPSDEIKIKMCDLFDCSMDYLMGETDLKTKEDELLHYISTQDKITVLQTLQRELVKLVNCKLEESDIDKIVNLLTFNVGDKFKSVKEQVVDINSYLKKFDKNKRKIVKNLMVECLKELIDSEKSRKIYHQLISSVENNIPSMSDKTINIPVLGKIAAGQPILAQEYLEGYLPVDPEIYGLTSDEECFYLKVAGESMNLKVKNGDYVLVKKQDTAEDGDLIVAIVNGDGEATLKRYKRLNDQFVLLEPMSSDTTIQSITIDLSNDNFKIIGKAIGQFGKF